MWTSFFNGLFGRATGYVLVRLGLFIAFCSSRIFKVSVRRPSSYFPPPHFAFIETLFDTSLSLRGGPYLEMILFFAFGAILFDFSLENKTRIFLSYVFVFSYASSSVISSPGVSSFAPSSMP
jgi:hypothetical protein